MADSTRLFQLSESLKECQDAIIQQQTTTTAFQRQHTHNTSFQQQLTEVTDMLRTLVTTHAVPPPERPPVANPGIFPILGQDDHHINGREGRREPRFECDDQGWHHQDDRRDHFDDDFQQGD